MSRLACLPSSALAAQTGNPNWTPASEFELELGEKGVTITGYKGEAATVNIPAVIDDSPVVAIGEGAFRDCSGLFAASKEAIRRRLGTGYFRQEEMTAAAKRLVRKGEPSRGGGFFVWRGPQRGGRD